MGQVSSTGGWGILLNPQIWSGLARGEKEKPVSGDGLSTGVFPWEGLLRTHGLESSQPLGITPFSWHRDIVYGPVSLNKIGQITIIQKW